MKETAYQRAFRFLLDEYYQTPKRWDDYLTVKAAVEKETPLLVRESTRGTFPNGDGTNHTTYECPCCKNLIHLDWLEPKNYCSVCGQRIILPGQEEKPVFSEARCGIPTPIPETPGISEISKEDSDKERL